jgi:Zn-dependent alcohol dehydrogenase
VTQNVTIFGINHYERRHLRDALDVLRRTRGRYPYERIVSHRYPLEQINEAMAAQNTGTVTGASLDMSA